MITKTWTGTHFAYEGECVVITGPITGAVTTADGTIYDVSDAVIEVDPEHAAEVAHLIGTEYALNGHPTDDTFIYTPPTVLPEGTIVMALASVTAANASLNGISGTGSVNQIGFVALHSASPGTTGANENAATGGYVRLACSWNAAASSAMTNSTSLTFSTSGTIAVTHLSGWSLVSAGVYGIGTALGSSVTAASITVAAGAISFTSA